MDMYFRELMMNSDSESLITWPARALCATLRTVRAYCPGHSARSITSISVFALASESLHAILIPNHKKEAGEGPYPISGFAGHPQTLSDARATSSRIGRFWLEPSPYPAAHITKQLHVCYRIRNWCEWGDSNSHALKAADCLIGMGKGTRTPTPYGRCF